MSDLISRKQAVEAMYALVDGCVCDDEWRENPHIDAIIDTLENLPSAQPEVLAHGEGELSAQPERKKGNWILIADGYTDYVKCDQCGNISYVERNFCPSCGADMQRGEQHG